MKMSDSPLPFKTLYEIHGKGTTLKLAKKAELSLSSAFELTGVLNSRNFYQKSLF